MASSPCRPTCRVEFIATPEDLSVHIHEHGNPDSLLFADEDERSGIERLFLHAWRFIRTRDISGVDLRFAHQIPYGYRKEIARWIEWLLRGGRTPE